MSIAPAGNALILVEDFKLLLGIDSDNPNTDTNRLQLFINIASAWIERTCRRKFITPSIAIDEIFDGDGTDTYYARNKPISGTPALAIWNGSAFETTIQTFTHDAASGLFYFTDGSVFTGGNRNWRLQYKYGYAADSVPDDLRMLCATVAQRMMLRVDKQGVDTESFGDTSTTFSLKDLDEWSKAIISDYRRICVG